MNICSIKKNIFSQERIVIYFSEFNINNLSHLGRINFVKTHGPLSMHTHKDSVEICYLHRGKQTYIVESEEYNLKGGDVFISFPDEVHGSGYYPEDKSVLYYLIIDLKSNPDNFLGYHKDDIQELHTGLINIKRRLFKGDESLKDILDKVISIYYSEDQFKKIRIQNLMTEFLIRIVELEKAESVDISSAIDDVLCFINNNIKESISIKSLAKKINLSESRFKQKFKKETGIPPREYILRKKIDLSQQILRYNNVSITDVAHELSFSSSQYFSTVFKRFTGISPTEYKKSF